MWTYSVGFSSRNILVLP